MNDKTLHAEIVRLRTTGRVHCGIISTNNIIDIANAFGLSTDSKTYNEIDAETACHILTEILHSDLAYNSEIMPLQKAAELASRFLKQYPERDCRFFTNGSLFLKANVKSWNPATDATFDTGVIVLGPNNSGCLWVED